MQTRLRVGSRSQITHSHYAALKTKDAIVDRLRDRLGARPSVDKRNPDVRVALHWVGDHASLALDVAGGSLHTRGYRLESGEAPLKVNVAGTNFQLKVWKALLDLGARGNTTYTAVAERVGNSGGTRAVVAWYELLLQLRREWAALRSLDPSMTTTEVAEDASALVVTSQFICTRSDIADGQVYWLTPAAPRGHAVIMRLRQAVVTAGLALTRPAPPVAVFRPSAAAVAQPDLDATHLVQVAEVALGRGPAHPGHLRQLCCRHLLIARAEQALDGLQRVRRPALRAGQLVRGP